uniref:Abhydrolase domain containing 12B n=2 Tax=Latimeria chalumnae TaxID=7897 RepID=M3XH19_LATCH
MRQRNTEKNQHRASKRGKESVSKAADGGKEASKAPKNELQSGILHRIRRFVLILFIIYVTIPFLICLFPVLLAKVVYLNNLRAPFFVDLQRPSELLLNHTVNFYLSPEDGVSVGIWHTVPDSRWQEAHGKDQSWYEAALTDNNPVIIYLHGNGGTRAVGHRVELIKVLSAAGFHVLALDYRGFADSTGDTSEEGMTKDSAFLYEWVKAHSKNSPVCLWGHSLGTGVATNAAKMLQEKGTLVNAVILEAPYTNIREEGASHPFGQLYRIFPGFEYFFLDTMAINNIVFPNDKNIESMSSPLLILHAEDDHVVPFEHGTKLYNIAQNSHTLRGKVKFVSFSATLGYRHNNIYKDSRLPQIVREFLSSVV